MSTIEIRKIGIHVLETPARFRNEGIAESIAMFGGIRWYLKQTGSF